MLFFNLIPKEEKSFARAYRLAAWFFFYSIFLVLAGLHWMKHSEPRAVSQPVARKTQAEEPNILFPNQLNRDPVDEPLRLRCEREDRWKMHGSVATCVNELRQSDLRLPVQNLWFSTAAGEDQLVPARARCLDREIWKIYGSLPQCILEKNDVDTLRNRKAQYLAAQAKDEALMARVDRVGKRVEALRDMVIWQSLLRPRHSK